MLATISIVVLTSGLIQAAGSSQPRPGDVLLRVGTGSASRYVTFDPSESASTLRAVDWLKSEDEYVSWVASKGLCAFVGERDNRIGLYLQDTTKTKPVLLFEGYAVRPFLSKAADVVVFESLDGSVDTILVARTSPTHVTSLSLDKIHTASWLVISDDGQQLLFTGGIEKFESQIWLAGLDGKDPIQLTDRGARPCFIPGGKLCAYISWGEESMEIVIQSTASRKVSKRISVDGFATLLSASPDGKSLASMTTDGFSGRQWQLTLIDIETGEMERVDIGELDIKSCSYIR